MHELTIYEGRIVFHHETDNDSRHSPRVDSVTKIGRHPDIPEHLRFCVFGQNLSQHSLYTEPLKLLTRMLHFTVQNFNLLFIV